MRVFSGIVFGYLFFELLWRLLFSVTNTDRHAPASISFEAGAVAFGLIFAVTAGFLASFIGGRPHFIAAWIAGALVALTSIAVMIHKGPAWPQIAALLFMSPGVVVGGYTYVLRRRTQTDSETK
jgi:fructose-specific phosphotransferase system IIC component